MNDAPQVPERSLRDRLPSPLPLAIAVAIVVAVSIPGQVLDIGYDPNVLDYWVRYGLPVIALAFLAGVVRNPLIRGLPERAAQLVLAPSPKAFALALGTLTVVAVLVVQWIAYRRFPSTADEIAQLWHAKILASGALALPPDANPEFFAIDNIVDVGRWYSQYPIGGPAALVPGVLIGAPWIVHPLLAGATVALTYQFSRVAFGELQARAVALVLAQSQTLLLMSGTYLNHVPTLFLASAVMAALAQWERAESLKPRLAWAALVGLLLGLIATVRPLDAIAVAAAAGAFQVYVIGFRPARWIELVMQGLAGVIGTLPLLISNALTTGSPWVFGYDAAWGDGHRIGFHADPTGEVHSFARGVAYAARYVSELNFATVGWPVPLLAIIVIGLLVMRRTTRWDALLLGLVGAQVSAYALYWGLGEYLGPRFLYTAIPAIVILAVRAPFLAADVLGPPAGRMGFMLIALSVLVTWLAPHPATARGFVAQMTQVRRGFRLDVAEVVRQADIHNAIVFIREATSARILHRLWGIGMPRDEAGRLFTTSDACTVLVGIREAERDTALSVEKRLARVRQLAVPLPDTGDVLGTRDSGIKFAGRGTITDACRAELDADTFVPGVFGPSLLLNTWGADGRLAGDVIYAQDLTEHNEVLRRRFAGRTWYRLEVAESPEGVLSGRIVPY